MPHPFELRKEIDVDARPEAVWEALATGPGMDGWYIDTGNIVEPGVGGRIRVSFGDGAFGGGRITAWEPGHRLAEEGEPGPGGVTHNMEYVIETRPGGKTVIRLVHSGFLADDWEAEYDALDEGDFLYLHQLAQYVTRFRGRPVTLVTAVQPIADPARARQLVLAALGVDGDLGEGDTVRLQTEGLAAIDGVVHFVSPTIVGVRTSDALYCFMTGAGFVYVGHHVYRDGVDRASESAAWQTWLERTVA